MAMKYIRLKSGAVILFSESINHNEMAGAFGGRENVESAGRVSAAVDSNEISAYGDSFTLKIKSDPSDKNIIYNNLSVYA